MVNRLTAPWYLDRLEAELRYRLGFLESLAGDWEKAMEHWRKVIEHDPLLALADRERYFHTLSRLESAAENRRFVGEAEENDRIPKRSQPCIAWADFLLLREEFDLAASLYDRIRIDAERNRDAETCVRAAVGQILVEATRYLQDPGDSYRLRQAATMAATTADQHPSAASSPYLIFLSAHYWPIESEDDFRKSMESLSQVIKKYPRHPRAAEAQYWYIAKVGHRFSPTEMNVALELLRSIDTDGKWWRAARREAEELIKPSR